MVVESTGIRSPYENRLHLRRRVFASLQTFLQLCECRVRRTATQVTIDPYGDLFMGFEEKRRPVLESIMNHHGLLVCQEKKITIEDIRH